MKVIVYKDSVALVDASCTHLPLGELTSHTEEMATDKCLS